MVKALDLVWVNESERQEPIIFHSMSFRQCVEVRTLLVDCIKFIDLDHDMNKLWVAR